MALITTAAARGTDTDQSQVLSRLPQINGNVVLQRLREWLGAGE